MYTQRQQTILENSIHPTTLPPVFQKNAFATDENQVQASVMHPRFLDQKGTTCVATAAEFETTM